MKRCFGLFLIVLILLFSACGNGNQPAVSGGTETAPSEIPSSTATPTPDFSGTDFSGRWYVAELIDSNGLPVSDAEKQNLEAGFILELLPSGTYFVYGQDGKVMGQGAYSVTLNQLILNAQGSQMEYEIMDADTLRFIEPDTSVTVMKREAIEPVEEGDGTDVENPDDSTQGGDQIEEETDFEDETEPAATPSSEASPANAE